MRREVRFYLPDILIIHHRELLQYHRHKATPFPVRSAGQVSRLDDIGI
jgi:hypothetical protein